MVSMSLQEHAHCSLVTAEALFPEVSFLYEAHWSTDFPVYQQCSPFRDHVTISATCGERNEPSVDTVLGCFSLDLFRSLQQADIGQLAVLTDHVVMRGKRVSMLGGRAVSLLRSGTVNVCPHFSVGSQVVGCSLL